MCLAAAESLPCLMEVLRSLWKSHSQERAPEVKLVNGVEVKRNSRSLPFKIESQILQLPLSPGYLPIVANTPAAKAQTPV